MCVMFGMNYVIEDCNVVMGGLMGIVLFVVGIINVVCLI